MFKLDLHLSRCQQKTVENFREIENSWLHFNWTHVLPHLFHIINYLVLFKKGFFNTDYVWNKPSVTEQSSDIQDSKVQGPSTDPQMCPRQAGTDDISYNMVEDNTVRSSTGESIYDCSSTLEVTFQ
jgi:hypothetical protein